MHNFKFSILALLMLIACALDASYISGPASQPITPSIGIPKFIQTAEAHHTTAGDLSVSFGALPAINDVVIVGIAINGGSGNTGNLIGTVSDNQGNSYSRLTIQAPFGSIPGVVSLWCTPVLVSSGTYTVTVSTNSTAGSGIMILEYRSTNCNADRNAGAVSASSPYSCGSFTSKNPKDLLLTFLFNPASTGTITYTAPAGFAIRQQQITAANGLTMAIAEEIVSAVGTFTPTFGASQNLASSQCSFAAIISQ